MSKSNALTQWLKPSSASSLNAAESPAPQKRKRNSTIAPVEPPEDESEDEPVKKKKTTKKKAPAKKAAPKKTPAKQTGGSKEAQQLYKKIIGDVDKKVSGLDARVKKMGPNSRSVTSDTYAEAMTKFSKDVKKLMELGPEGAKHAFNLLLYIGPHTHGDFEASMKMGGYGEHEEPYAELDELMLEAIAARDDLEYEATDTDSSLPKVPHYWTEKDADVGEFKTGRPNKQQRGQIDRQRAAWRKDRKNAARERREKVTDWISNAIEELKGEQAEIRGFGLEGYFEMSIAKLEELKAGGTAITE